MYHFISHLKKTVLLVLILCCASIAYAQNGVYEKKNANGAYGVISFEKTGNNVIAQVFTWWNSANAQTGFYYGEGSMKGNTVLLHSDENEPGCKVTLSIVQGKVKALFANCVSDHLPVNFNGLYNKISDAVAGGYEVTVPKAYFYQKTNKGSKRKAYLIKGDKVTIDMQNIAANNKEWGFVSYMNKAAKETTGYMLLSELKKIN